MNRLHISLLLFLTITLLSFSLPTHRAYAQTSACSFITTTPSPVKDNLKLISVTLSDNNGVLIDGNEYVIKINNDTVGKISILTNTIVPEKFRFTNNSLQISNIGPNGIIRPAFASIDPGIPSFEAKPYTLSVFTSLNTNALCSASFAVEVANPVQSCTIQFLNKSFTPQDSIIIRADNLPHIGGLFPDHRVFLQRSDGTQVKEWVKTTNNLTAPSGVDIEKHEPGNYYLEVRDSFKPRAIDEKRACAANFTIVPPGAKITGGPANPLGSSANPTPVDNPVCKPHTTNGKLSYVCDTALGEIDTDPALFVKKIFSILLSISGGIALILIIVSGYHFVASQGNPEKIQGARETLTSAIVGLLFIIFSMVILEVIGVDILHIPGLTK